MNAMQQAEATFAAAGEAYRLAWGVMRDGAIDYTDKLGWARRNLLQRWLFYTRLTTIGGPSLAPERARLRLAIKEYRRLNIAETRGIDTSAAGWRGTEPLLNQY